MLATHKKLYVTNIGERLSCSSGLKDVVEGEVRMQCVLAAEGMRTML